MNLEELCNIEVTISGIVFLHVNIYANDVIVCRSYIYLKERAYHMPLIAIRKSQFARNIFNSIGRLEVKLSNDEMLKNKFH